MDLLAARLARLGCPAFLRPPSPEALGTLALRRPLLLWLYAVYSDPSVRLAEDEKWASADSSDADVERWLQSLGVVGCADALASSIDAEKAMELLVCAAEGALGRALLEERGETACLAESVALLGDIAAHEASVFDSQCQIFPMSIQMQTAGRGDVTQRARQLSEDIRSLERQDGVLRSRIAKARDRVDALREDGAESASSQPDSLELGHEFVSCLSDSLALMKSVNGMLADDAACWTDVATPRLVGLGEAARLSSEQLRSLLSVFQDTEALVALVRRRDSSKEQMADVLAHCQETVDAAAPELRAQLAALESSLELRSSAEVLRAAPAADL